MGLKLGIWNFLVLGGHSGSRDLTFGCTICNIYGKELLRLWWMCLGGIWIEGGFTLTLVQQ